jgi:hypothetical protein
MTARVIEQPGEQVRCNPMIQAEVKRLHSPDADDLERYVPDDPVKFGILIQVMAAPRGVDGEESFDVLVCTPSWIADRMAPNEIVVGRHHLLVERYDFAALQQFITQFAERCVGECWDEAAQRLARLGKWEFEDYQEYDVGK